MKRFRKTKLHRKQLKKSIREPEPDPNAWKAESKEIIHEFNQNGLEGLEISFQGASKSPELSPEEKNTYKQGC